MVDDKTNVELIQQRTGFLLAGLAIISGCLNFIGYVKEGEPVWEVFFSAHVLLLFVIALIFLVSGFFRFAFLRYVQVFMIGAAGAGAIYDAYGSLWGYAMIALCIVTADRYGFLKKHVLKKAIAIALFYFIVLVSSASLNTGPVAATLSIFSFIFVTITYTVVLYKEKLASYYQLRISQKDNRILLIQQQLEERKREVEMLNAELAQLVEKRKQMPLSKYRLTDAETRVLQDLCLNGGSNKEIGERLFISESTVKAHMNKIFRKTQITDRWELREACRYNF